MKPKKASAQWTTSKLVKIVLLVVVLVLLTMAFPKQLLGLEEKAGGFMDDLAVRFGFVTEDNGVKLDDDCRQTSIGEVNGIYGKMVVCPENCSYDIAPKNFMGSSKFFLTSTGFKTRKDGYNHLINVDSWVMDEESAERHREAYEELIGVVEDYSVGQDMEVFYKSLDFDPESYFTIIIDTGEFTNIETEGDERYKLKFYFDGERWERKYLDQSSYLNSNEVFEEAYKYFSFGSDVYWKYKNEDTLMLPITNLDTNFQEIEFSDEEFSEWLTGKVNETDNLNNVSRFNIEIEQDRGKDKYFYKDYKWKKNGLVFNRRSDENFIFKEIVEANRNHYKITWHYNKEKIDRIPVSGEIIETRNIRSEDFNRWLKKTEKEFKDDKESQEEFLEDFVKYFDDNLVEVEFEGNNYEVFVDRVFREDGSKVLIYFETEEEKFGIYFEDGEFVLTKGEENKDSYVKDWVSLERTDWDELVKVNEIFDYMVESCA